LACSSHLTHHKSGPLISAAPKRRRLFLEFFRGGIQLRAVVADPLEALGLILADTMFAHEIVDFIAFAAGDAAAVAALGMELRRIDMNLRDGRSAFSDAGGHTLDRSAPHVADRENTRAAGFQWQLCIAAGCDEALVI
jgi:hypothetical protein